MILPKFLPPMQDGPADDRTEGARAVNHSPPAPITDAVEGQEQKLAKGTLGKSATSTDSFATSSTVNVNTDTASQTSSTDRTPGNVTFEMNGMTISIPVGEERLDLSEEPGEPAAA